MQLRPFQKEALDALKEPGHLLCVAPTGSGKSLIYERAAIKPGRRTLLVTPLVALARQQHARLRTQAGLPTGLGAGTPSEGPPSPGAGVWIISPEKLLYSAKLQQLRQWKPDFLVVDECHCLWEWGEGFRPAFRKIPELLRESSITTSLWLTATLPLEARQELREALPQPLRELGSFDLPRGLELMVARVRWSERVDALMGWLMQQREPGIVFVSTRETTLRLSRLIEASGRSVIAYHAGMGAEERRAAEARIAERMPDVIVATSAFGMGMDYPSLRWAVLWQAPATLLSFAQTIGRVGRNPAQRSRALALWDDDDFRMLEWTIQGSERRKRELAATRRYLFTARCRRAGLKAYFEGLGTGEESCGLCDFCAAAGMR